MTAAQIRARAVAYTASRDARHHQNLNEFELREFWTSVADLRPNTTARNAVQVIDERQELRAAFWRDQHGIPT